MRVVGLAAVLVGGAWAGPVGAEAGAAAADAVMVLPFVDLSRPPVDAGIGADAAAAVAGDLQAAGVAVVDGGGLTGAHAAPAADARAAAAHDAARGGGGASDGHPSTAVLATVRATGVRWLIAGAYRRVGERLRMTARLVDVATGAVRRRAQVDVPLSDPVSAHDRLAAALRSALGEIGAGVEAAAGRGPLGGPGTGASRAGAGTGVTGGLVFAETDPASDPAAPANPGADSGRRGDPDVPANPGVNSGRRADPDVPANPGVNPGRRADPDVPANPGVDPGQRADPAASANPGADPVRRAAPAAAVPPVAGAGQAAGADRRRGRPGPRPGGGFDAAPAAPPLVTIGRAAEPPVLDGRLGDAVWETATRITEFVQIAPVEGAPGTEATDVWIAYDRDHLYFAFHVHYSDPGIIRANRADRDEIRGDDRMSVLFDPFLDQQRAYQFSVNGYGVQSDSLVNADGSSGSSGRRSPVSRSSGGRGGGRRSQGGGSGLSNSGQFGIRGDDSWNALFETRGRMVEDGWTAEMAIPFKSLRYPAIEEGAGHRWGFQITRVIRGKSEAQAWSPVSRGIAGQLTQFGVIEGLSGLSQSRNLEVLPEVTGVSLDALDPATGAFDAVDRAGDLGVSVKYGITPNLTADFTYNPDFSQIESDQPQIETNQRFALFYPEQRPFFLEGQEIFLTATPLTLLHTRTIVDPRFGGKLTGKIGRTTLGVVVADDEAAGRFVDPADARAGATAQTIVGRARYDVYAESYLGVIATAREFGAEYNRVAGVDGRFRLGRTHRISFMGVGSETESAEFGSLAGPAFEVDLTRQGRNLSYGAAYSSVDPEFWTETGFLPRWNLRQTTANAAYRWWPESTLITWGPSVNYLRLYDHAGQLQDEQIQAMASFSFRNNVSVTANVSRDLERFEAIDFRKTGYGAFGVVSSRRLSVVGGVNRGDGILYTYGSFTNPLTADPYARAFLGRSTTGNFLISGRPSSRLRADLTGIFSRLVDPAAGSEVIDVRIFRSRTTYQFTDRLLLRYILEHNTFSKTLGNNVLLTYRINAGTVAFLGYDDRYRQGRRIDEALFPTAALQRTNRAVFGKISYLFRY